ncbi:hypothetical protein [Pedobacter cryoconitis]|uniref:ATP-dependent Zn protease n=1 Tax=Pedobacter cryoconitis TaxID=188932 RepID=A0A7X0J9A3_9SPHI|nr:hypothetical protein [Pedobacter cryoconitis]MBB6503019.1 ATP-dependent Zn protease [Pedobacter cryoconitis]
MKICVLLLLFLMAGCGLFKNTRTKTEKSYQSSKQTSESELVENKDWFKKSASLVFYRDSMRRDYAVQLWPKGAFIYSPEKGFSGQADSILFIGSSNELLTYSGETIVQELDKGRIEERSKQSKKDISQQQTREKQSQVSWKWIMWVLVLTAFIGLWWYEKSIYNLNWKKWHQ